MHVFDNPKACPSFASGEVGCIPWPAMLAAEMLGIYPCTFALEVRDAPRQRADCLPVVPASLPAAYIHGPLILEDCRESK